MTKNVRNQINWDIQNLSPPHTKSQWDIIIIIILYFEISIIWNLLLQFEIALKHKDCTKDCNVCAFFSQWHTQKNALHSLLFGCHNSQCQIWKDGGIQRNKIRWDMGIISSYRAFMVYHGCIHRKGKQI